MPNFKKLENDLSTRLDKWLFFIKNLEDFQDIPTIFTEEIFNQAFEKAELANYNQVELDNYENSLKVYRDLNGVIDTAYEEGKLEGFIDGKKAIAKTLKTNGYPTSEITRITGLTENEIKEI